MKAMTRTQLASYAGVCLETFKNWLEPHQQTLTEMGYPPGRRIIPPQCCRVDVQAIQHRNRPS